MKLMNNDYINSKFVNTILINENSNANNSVGIGKDLKYQVLYKEELFDIDFNEINHSLFIQVPAVRLIETIEAEAEVILNIDKNIIHFEIEKDVKYLINLNNIIRVQKLDTHIWKINMVDDVYYFKAFPANFSVFINRLHA